jgi:rhodanese-related sulfurtransferase
MVILDVRSRATSSENPLTKNADKIINIPLEELSGSSDILDRDMIYVPYCGGAYKSSLATSWLAAHKFSSKKMYI